MMRWLFVLIILLCSAISEAQVTPAIKQKGNNVGPAGLSNIGVLPCIATAAAPVYTEGFQVGCSTDLAGTMRTSVGGGGAGGTSSTFGAAFPATGTASGWSDGTNMQGARVFDLDTGVGTQYVAGSTLRCSAAGGSTECLPATAIDADGIANQTSTYIHGMSYMYNGATWDRVRGTIAGGLLMQVSNATLAVTQSGVWTVGVSNAFLLDATFTGRINTLGQKAMAASTPVVLASDQASIPVAATVSNAFLLDATFTGRFAAATLDADTIANETTTSIHGKCYLYNGATWDRCRGAVATGLLVNISNATLAVTQSTSPWVANITQFGSNNVVTGVGNSGVGIPRFTMSSDSILASITATVNIQGAKTNNNAAPGATNVGVLPCIANAAAPTWVEGNQVGCSTTLSGAGRTEIEVGGVAAGVATPLAVRESNGTSFFSSDTIGVNVYKKVSTVQDIEVSSVNSSTANIGVGVSFTGTSNTTLGVGAIQVNLFADQGMNIQVQQSQEDPGVNWNITDSWNYVASSSGNDAARTIQATGSSVRVIVTNIGDATTTAFRVQTVVCPVCDTLPRGLTALGNLKTAIVEPASILSTMPVFIIADNTPVLLPQISGLNKLTQAAYNAGYCRRVLCPPVTGGLR